MIEKYAQQTFGTHIERSSKVFTDLYQIFFFYAYEKAKLCFKYLCEDRGQPRVYM